MMFRSMMMGAAVVFAVGCRPETPKPDAGCVGITCPTTGGGTGFGGGGGTTGGGTGGGATGGGGVTGGGTGGGVTGGGSGSFGWDGGPTVDAIRNANFCGERVHVENVIVVGVENSFRGNLGDYNAQFWVVDTNNPMRGIYVDKFYTDLPTTYNPTLGDVLTIDGFVRRQSRNNDRRAGRTTLGSTFGCGTTFDAGVGIETKLIASVTSAGVAVPENMVGSGFGNAMSGTGRPNPEYAATRVTIPGPLTLVDPRPLAFSRISTNTSDTSFYGFEVSGGILVNNYHTFDIFPSDGGTPTIRCDWRKIAIDAGSGTVVFPNGISGIWETYSHAPCRNGSTSCNDGFTSRDSGIVPGTNNEFTYVLYPEDCADLDGVVQ